ncbi:hypothetical protein ACFL6N_03220 [Thermodesulfobacteriota bacterium]
MNMPKNRWLACASHFGISLVIFIVLLILIVFFWYSGALYTAAGGWQGVRIVIGVDLVLGPLLTLIIYNINKPRKVLYRDLLVIALIQLSCLTAGVYIIYYERPITVIYAYDKFHVLKHSDFIKIGINPDTLDLNMMTPKILYTEMTPLVEVSGVDRKTIATLYTLAGKELAYRTDLYRPFPVTRQESDVVLSDNRLLQYHGHRADCVTTELVSAFEEGIVCFDVTTQQFEEFVKAEDL